jgi:Putative zinc-finger
MCDERERLLDYLYEACDADDRRRFEAHLDVCEECREELSGLRAVRQDLLAWDVPEHGSVWKPFVPSQVAPWWRGVPVWALAAAASVTFMVGLAGGLVSRSLMPVRVVTTAGEPVSVPAVSRADLAATERRLLAAMQAQLDERMRPMPAHVLTPAPAVNRDEILKEVQSMLAASEQRQQQALGASMRTLLQDSDRTFVRNANFRNELQRFHSEVALALQQQGGRQ